MTKGIQIEFIHAFNWRKYLSVHPAAELFPAMAEAELDDLATDIARYGLQTPIVVWSAADDDEPHEALLDGRNRLDAAARAGLLGVHPNGKLYIRHPSGDYVPIPKSYSREDDPYAVVISANIRRRHLSTKERQDLLISLIARKPELSDRQIAKTLGVDSKTIGTARAKGEDVGRIPHVETRTDSQGRKQPAKKSKPRRPSPPPVVRQDLIDQAMALIRQMRDIDFGTWARFDRIYQKAREKLSEIPF
jgi:ParB-like chromosome segregation protein Spo0J